MPKGKPKGALPATPGCPLPGTAPGIIEGGVCWLGNGEGPGNKEERSRRLKVENLTSQLTSYFYLFSLQILWYFLPIPKPGFSAP